MVSQPSLIQPWLIGFNHLIWPNLVVLLSYKAVYFDLN